MFYFCFMNIFSAILQLLTLFTTRQSQMKEMDRKELIIEFTLAYSPLCNSDFTAIKTDTEFQEIIDKTKSSLYAIVQRPEIRFDNITINEKEEAIDFEIRQHNNPHVLKCKIPYFQKHIADPADKVLVYFGSHDKYNNLNASPFNNIHGIKFYRKNNKLENCLLWISPEKFLQHYWDGCLDAEIQGNIRDFTKYHVHYVGQATKQNILKRLTGHEKLQDILSLEHPFKYGSLPTHEISILLFSFKYIRQMHKFGQNSNIDEIEDSLMGNNLPELRTIILDLEKALINEIEPEYNEQLFKNYPKSSDGLNKHNYDSISYSFTDPITLVYAKGQIEGNLDFLDRDTIIIHDNKKMELIKHKKD